MDAIDNPESSQARFSASRSGLLAAAAKSGSRMAVPTARPASRTTILPAVKISGLFPAAAKSSVMPATTPMIPAPARMKQFPWTGVLIAVSILMICAAFAVPSILAYKPEPQVCPAKNIAGQTLELVKNPDEWVNQNPDKRILSITAAKNGFWVLHEESKH